jgi:multiple sugar transport system permease protein
MPIQTAQIPLTYTYRWFDFFGTGKLVGLFTGETLTMNLLPNLGRFLVPAIFGVGLNAGIFIFMFRQFFAGMPRDLEEAAKLDGCSPFKIYWRVMLPNIIPVLVTVLLLSLIYYWNDSLVAGMSKLDMGTPLMVEIKKLATSNYAYDQLTIIRKEVEQYSILLSAVLPLTVLFIVCQRFFVECMDRSGSKG